MVYLHKRMKIHNLEEKLNGKNQEEHVAIRFEIDGRRTF